MVGIVALTRPLEAKLEIVPKKIRSEMATTISAILATAPITVLNFESFSIVALIVNLFVLPLIPLLSLLGLINLITATVSIQLGRIISYFVIPFMDYVIKKMIDV